MQQHAPGDAAANGAGLVHAEVDTGDSLQQGENTIELPFIARWSAVFEQAHIDMLELTAELGQLKRDLAGRQDNVDMLGGDAAARHVWEPRRFRTLDHGDTALSLDAS